MWRRSRKRDQRRTKGGVRGSQRDKELKVIRSHAAVTLVSLSSTSRETTYMNPETSSDFMVSLKSNEHNIVLP